MELRVLRYFLTVAQVENITKAAEILHLTQPTLSRQLSQLEEELGVILFERGSHRIHLTQDGLLLQRSAQEMLDLAEKTKEQFRQEDVISGTISFGCGELMSMSKLAALMAEFRRQYPMIHFDIESGNADHIKYKLEKGLLDFGLLLEPVDITEYEFLRMNVKEKWGAFLRKDYPIARKKYMKPKDFQNATIILSKREAVRNEIMNWLGPYAKSVEESTTFNLNYNGMAAVRQGMGIALSLKLACIYDDVVFLPLKPPIEHDSVLVWKRNQPHTKTIETFIEFAKKRLLP
ncbi:MAG: LysR family transcriptional regulator [Spirochaetia bacterium]|nr:LysR family transcriptional regulator [Spirochaetia bacterium]MBR4797436.1 LysR family transcriptional regulator [Spirochaetia bacterium]MBR5017173.1 LysR family transcriptional regulator [Spirochaetia bacterium]